MTFIKDISDIKYKRIIESSYTPQWFRKEWLRKVRERQPTIQLFVAKNFEAHINEYYLMIGIPFDSIYLTFTYLCEQPPTFVISDIFNIIISNRQNHGGNTYLINQYLNGSGYKNLEHILMDIFIQEMSVKMARFQLSETAVLFNDYSYLIQKSLTSIQNAANSLELVSDEAQSFFFFLLSVEESIKKLNQEYMFLYFCFYKIADETRINKDEWEPLVHELKKSYFNKIDHHINAIKFSFRNQNGSEIAVAVSIQLENLLKHLDLFQKKNLINNITAPVEQTSAPLMSEN